MPLEIQQAYTRSQQILTLLQQGAGSGLHVIYQPGVVSPYDRVNTLRYYGFITDLRAKIDIKSLAESALPNIDTGTNRTARIESVRDLEWRSERIELDLLMRTTYSGGWVRLITISLLNRLPFYVINVLQFISDQVAFAVANDAVLAVQVRDVGYGLLGANDEVVIFGSVREEVTVVPSEAPEITTSHDSSLEVGQESQVVLTANPHRKQATFINTSPTFKVNLTYASTAQARTGLVLYPNGGSYEINQSNLYRGSISAICDGGTAILSMMEGI